MRDAAAAAAVGGGKGDSVGGRAKTAPGLPGAAAGSKAAGSSGDDQGSPTWRRDRAGHDPVATLREEGRARQAAGRKPGDSKSKSKSKLTTS